MISPTSPQTATGWSSSHLTPPKPPVDGGTVAPDRDIVPEPEVGASYLKNANQALGHYGPDYQQQSRAEFKKNFSESLGPDLDKVFGIIDQNDDGAISVSERAAFDRVLDQEYGNGDGQLRLDDYNAFLQELKGRPFDHKPVFMIRLHNEVKQSFESRSTWYEGSNYAKDAEARFDKALEEGNGGYGGSISKFVDDILLNAYHSGNYNSENAEAARELAKALDTDHNGVLDAKEFAHYTQGADKLFGNGDGSADWQELDRLLRKLTSTEGADHARLLADITGNPNTGLVIDKPTE